MYCIPFPHKRHANAAVTGRRKTPLCLYGLKSNGALAFYNRFVALYTVKNVELILTHTHTKKKLKSKKAIKFKSLEKREKKKVGILLGCSFPFSM